LAILFLMLDGCQSLSPSVEDVVLPAELSVEQHIREAFLLPSPIAKREAVLTAVEAFLRDSSIRQLDDTAASSLLTDITFQSGQPIFADPTFVRRQGTLVVVGLPDGLGLYLYDLSIAAFDARPLQLSAWTVGLSSVDVVWAGNELGVSYETIGNDQALYVHYVVGIKSELGWRVMWSSDDEPDWWFNAQNATISVAPYLSRLTVTGEAAGSTPIFREEGTGLRRVFRVEWLRDQEHYRLSPAMGSQKDRQNWVWHVAIPSAYSTLVEFIERVRLRDTTEATQLVSEPSILATAFSFGLHLPDVQYTIAAYDEESITFQSQQGAFVATFEPPADEGSRWLIIGLQPMGAASSATPQP
jgi:hypothetical protein